MANLSWPYQPPFTYVMRMMLHASVTVWLPPGMKIPHVAHHTWLMLAVVTAHCSSWSWGATQICTLAITDKQGEPKLQKDLEKKERDRSLLVHSLFSSMYHPGEASLTWRECFSAFCSRSTNKRQTFHWQVGMFKDYHQLHKAVGVSFRFPLQKM